MWKLKLTSQFKKDFKRIQNQPEKLKALDAVLSALVLPAPSLRNICLIRFPATGPITWNAI